MGKVVMAAFSEDVVRGSSDAQMCGRSSGSEGAIHAMRRMYTNERTDAVILVDAANAFNNINREALIHNIKYICPEIATYVTNCYSSPARLFVVGGLEIKSQEGTTQGDPLGMAIYALGVTPMLNILLIGIGNNHNRMVAFADDITAAGSLDALKKWWDHLLEIGPSYGYYPQPTKSWLIVKPDQLEQAQEKFAGTDIKITSDGERHLGAVIGTDENKSQYINQKIDDWTQEINLLAEIAATYPQAAYSAYVSSYQHKLTYFLRTIPTINDELKRVDEAVRHRLIPSLTGGRIINDQEKKMLSLPPRLGGMGLKIYAEESSHDHRDSMSATVALQNQILQTNDGAPEAKSKSRLHNERQQRHQEKLRAFLETADINTKRTMETLNQKGVSNWLTSIPLNEQGFELTKQEFWDAIRIRYNWPLDRLPSTCACGSSFDLAHALSCKKGGFVSLRHNEIRDITSKLLREVCVDVRTEPLLNELNNEDLPRHANVSREARLDISALSFWTAGQRAFFDVRVFNPFARRYTNSKIENCLSSNEREKKRQYGERILQAENGTFSPLVFAANGAMGRECTLFYKRLAEMIADKRHETFSKVTNSIRTIICFSLVRSTVRCIRGSRGRVRLPQDEV
ncbi:uncharacterized protein [Clytia hemisphaerica]|uniref:uncharacterized protein n=1 Tax=Clytia hemisphaerica TaxID=252671 RepID=UPI0034D5037E